MTAPTIDEWNAWVTGRKKLQSILDRCDYGKLYFIPHERPSMTPEQQEVIEAARAVCKAWEDRDKFPGPTGSRLVAAVRALDQPYRVGELEHRIEVRERDQWVGIARANTPTTAYQIVAALNEKAAREAGKP